MNLKENERMDDLEFKDLKIIQNIKGFCFGIDSVLLSDFAKEMRYNSKVIDLGNRYRHNKYFTLRKDKFKRICGSRDSRRCCRNGWKERST